MNPVILSRIIPVEIYPQIFMLMMACATLLGGLFAPISARRVVTYALAQIGLVGAFVLTLMHQDLPVLNQFISLPQKALDGSTYYFATFYFNFLFSRMSFVMQLFILATSSLALIYSRHYLKEHRMKELEYYSLALFSVLGMMIMVSGASFLTLYLGLELMSLPLYAMVALQKDIERTSEAAMKYFVMGALASGMLLYGISLVYGVTGSIQLGEIHAVLIKMHTMPLLLVVGLVFVMAGVVFKFGAVPFHMWVPDVYEGAPTVVTAFIASAPKIAVLGMITMILIVGFPVSLIGQWQQILIAVVVLSMALGNVLAIAQTNIKRMLAYSSIAQLGYMLLGFVTATPKGYAMSLFYSVTYSLMAIGAFGLIALMNKVGVEIETLEDFRGLNTRSPWLAFLMLLLMFSMAGVPPTVGFFAKLGVLEALVSAGYIWLAVLALVLALIGAFYYLRVVKVMYFEKPLEGQRDAPKISWDAHTLLGVNGMAILILGLLPSGLIDLCRWAFGV